MQVSALVHVRSHRGREHGVGAHRWRCTRRPARKDFWYRVPGVHACLPARTHACLHARMHVRTRAVMSVRVQAPAN